MTALFVGCGAPNDAPAPGTGDAAAQGDVPITDDKDASGEAIGDAGPHAADASAPSDVDASAWNGAGDASDVDGAGDASDVDAGDASDVDDAGGDAGSPQDDATTPDAHAPVDAATLDGPTSTLDAAATGGHVVFMMPTADHWSSIVAQVGATPGDLDAKLGAVSAGDDEFVSIAHDGASLVLVGSRFACAADDCLDVAPLAATSAVAVAGSSGPLEAAARAAIASGGDVIVYPATGGPHQTDLYAIKKVGGVWSTPLLLTATSPGAYQHDVNIAHDASKVVYVCGPSPYQVPQSSICESKIDGSGTAVTVAYASGPGASSQSVTHHPDYAPDGTIVFEADWGGSERIWRATGAAYTLVSPAGVDDDNSPCVLPDGRIASLWLGRAGNTQSVHELKVMNADGSGGAMLLTDVDIVDVGESCGP